MDLHNAADEIGISIEAYKHLCSLFIENTDKDMVKLKAAFDSNRRKEAADLAHHIKGAASNMEFPHMADTAKRLQLQALDTSSDTRSLDDNYEKLAALYATIKAELEAQL
jgi:HPt (histidine-containing phosphotransfer) domain-containing protein